MTDESGFSVAELVAALLILSLMAVPLSHSVGNMLSVWNQAKSDVQSTQQMVHLVLEIEAAEFNQRASTAFTDGPSLQITDGPPLQLSSPKRDRDASCEFDLTGRRCR